MTKEIISRYNKPTPKIIKKLIKITSIILASATGVSGIFLLFPTMEVPKWIPMVFAVLTVLNPILLELFTEEDNK